MSKKLRGFTLVEALVIMTVVAVLLAATTRLVTRKVKSAPEKTMHGRYEAYYEKNGKAWHAYFDGSGEPTLWEECDNKPSTIAANGGRAVCTFVPPAAAENFHIQAVGGGGAGGSAGGSGPTSTNASDGSGTAPGASGDPTHDDNGGKYRTRPTNTTPFNQYLDLRTYNENNGEVSNGGNPPQAKDGSSDITTNANRCKVSVLANNAPYGSHVFYEKFPKQTHWPEVLGSSKTKPVIKPIPNWFDWKAIEQGRVGQAGKIGSFDVVATACSSTGGTGGDFKWTTKDDYLAIRNTYDTFGSKYCSPNGSPACSWSSVYPYAATGWSYTPKRSCGSNTYYRCDSSIQTGTNSCTTSCPSFSDMCDKVNFAKRTTADITSTITGQKGGYGAPGGSGIIDPANFNCGMVVSSSIAKGMTASAVLSDCKIITKGEHKMADNCPDKGGTLAYNPVDHTTVKNDTCAKNGPDGATGVARIVFNDGMNNNTATALGGQGGRMYCPEQKGAACTYKMVNGVQVPTSYYCYYSFAGPSCKAGCGCGSPAAPGGQVHDSSPSPFPGPNPYFKDRNTPGSVDKACGTINGYNYCRTGLYNYEYSYEMARGFKQLAYGDKGETGKFETKTVGQINKPVKIVVGKGGEWKDTSWTKDATSRGPSGSATVVGSYLTIGGGAGGQGALKSDRYELCSIFEKGKYPHTDKDNKNSRLCEFIYNDYVDKDGKNVLEKTFGPNYKYFRIQPGTKGEKSQIDTTAKNSKLDGKTPGKGGNGIGTVSTKEFVCNKRAIYNLMATTASPYNAAFKYNGYKIVEAFKQSSPAVGSADDLLCAKDGTKGVGNAYYIEPDVGNPMSSDKTAFTTTIINDNLKGHDAAVIITW